MQGRILLVDDDASLSRLFTKVLVKQGYQVDTVVSAENAQALLYVRRYDVLISDLNLGGERGIDLIRNNRALLDAFNTQIVVVSGQDHLRGLCEQMGISLFLSKPVGTHELAHFIGRIMSGRQPLPTAQAGTGV